MNIIIFIKSILFYIHIKNYFIIILFYFHDNELFYILFFFFLVIPLKEYCKEKKKFLFLNIFEISTPKLNKNTYLKNNFLKLIF